MGQYKNNSNDYIYECVPRGTPRVGFPGCSLFGQLFCKFSKDVVGHFDAVVPLL